MKRLLVYVVCMIGIMVSGMNRDGKVLFNRLMQLPEIKDGFVSIEDLGSKDKKINYVINENTNVLYYFTTDTFSAASIRREGYNYKGSISFEKAMEMEKHFPFGLYQKTEYEKQIQSLEQKTIDAKKKGLSVTSLEEEQSQCTATYKKNVELKRDYYKQKYRFEKPNYNLEEIITISRCKLEQLFPGYKFEFDRIGSISFTWQSDQIITVPKNKPARVEVCWNRILNGIIIGDSVEVGIDITDGSLSSICSSYSTITKKKKDLKISPDITPEEAYKIAFEYIYSAEGTLNRILRVHFYRYFENQQEEDAFFKSISKDRLRAFYNKYYEIDPQEIQLVYGFKGEEGAFITAVPENLDENLLVYSVTMKKKSSTIIDRNDWNIMIDAQSGQVISNFSVSTSCSGPFLLQSYGYISKEELRTKGISIPQMHSFNRKGNTEIFEMFGIDPENKKRKHRPFGR